MFYLHVK